MPWSLNSLHCFVAKQTRMGAQHQNNQLTRAMSDVCQITALGC
jgi:hypothetical protein